MMMRGARCDPLGLSNETPPHVGIDHLRVKCIELVAPPFDELMLSASFRRLR